MIVSDATIDGLIGLLGCPATTRGFGDESGVALPERKPAQTVDTPRSPLVHRQFSPPGEPSEPRAPRLLKRTQLGDIPLPTWPIDGVLASNKLSQTFGPPGSGKLFLELERRCVSASATR